MVADDQMIMLEQMKSLIERIGCMEFTEFYTDGQ
jgi:hypothetical protein